MSMKYFRLQWGYNYVLVYTILEYYINNLYLTIVKFMCNSTKYMHKTRHHASIKMVLKLVCQILIIFLKRKT